MKLKFYGTRGSIPICDAGFQQFGGNTTCLQITDTNQIAIIDAGTGLRNLGLTVSQVGLIAATYTWSFAIFQLFSGVLLDRLGARAVLGPAIALVTAGVFACAHAGNFPFGTPSRACRTKVQ
jgi:MFS family permease